MHDSVEHVLSEFVVTTGDHDVPDAARQSALRQVFDCIGVTLAAATEPPAGPLLEVVELLGGTPQARILGTGIRTSLVHAAWANGTLAHVLDFDDAGFSHPTACILPSALAAAEHRDANGRELLTAMVLGYEVFERFAAAGRSNEPRLRERGYHPTPLYGSLGAAAAAGRLLGLDGAQLQYAFGLAAGDSSGLTQHFGTWAKGLNAGNAARTGMMSALLALEGFRGDAQAVSGDHGLFSAVHGTGAYSFDGTTDGLGARWSIVDPGLSVKLYPACGINRRPVDAVLRLWDHPAYAPEKVERIDVHVHPAVFQTLRHRAPTAGFQGKFSLDYTVASAALDGRLTIESFSDQHAGRPEFRRLLARVRLHEHPEWDALRYREIPVSVVLVDGTVLEGTDMPARGTRSAPLSRGELISKYLDCAGRALGTAAATASVGPLLALGEAPSVRGVIELVTIDGKRPDRTPSARSAGAVPAAAARSEEE